MKYVYGLPSPWCSMWMWRLKTPAARICPLIALLLCEFLTCSSRRGLHPSGWVLTNFSWTYRQTLQNRLHPTTKDSLVRPFLDISRTSSSRQHYLPPGHVDSERRRPLGVPSFSDPNEASMFYVRGRVRTVASSHGANHSSMHVVGANAVNSYERLRAGSHVGKRLRDLIKDKLGFTCSAGVGHNKVSSTGIAPMFAFHLGLSTPCVSCFMGFQWFDVLACTLPPRSSGQKLLER